MDGERGRLRPLELGQGGAACRRALGGDALDGQAQAERVARAEAEELEPAAGGLGRDHPPELGPVGEPGPGALVLGVEGALRALGGRLAGGACEPGGEVAEAACDRAADRANG